MSDNFNRTEFSETNVLVTEADPAANLEAAHTAMLKEIRSWSYWSLGLGALHIIASGFLDSSWGILLIIVGLASFYFRTASILIIYAVTLTWAALSNLASMNPEWMLFALFQIFLAIRVFLNYRHFRNTEDMLIQNSVNVAGNSPLVAKQRAAKSFPWIGALFSCSSILGIAALFAFTIALAAIYGLNSEPPVIYSLLIGILETLGVLGFSVSLASLLSKHTPKALPIIGLVAGSLIMILWLLLSLSFA